MMGAKRASHFSPSWPPIHCPLSLLDAQITVRPLHSPPANEVPEFDNWIHEIKHGGYRMIVQRDANRVRLFTRNGHDWTKRYPRIVKAALRNRNSSS